MGRTTMPFHVASSTMRDAFAKAVAQTDATTHRTLVTKIKGHLNWPRRTPPTIKYKNR